MGPETPSPEKSEHLPLGNALNAFYVSEKFLQLKANTQSAYRGDLKRLQRSLSRSGIESVSQITPEAINGYLSSLQRQPNTITRYLFSIKSFLQWATANQLVDPSLKDRLPENPDLKRRSPLSHLSEWEIVELVEKSRGNLRNLALVTLALETGARATELLDLNVDDIRSNSPTQISIRFTNGTGKVRNNSLEGESAEIIRRHAAEQGSGSLFCSTKDPSIGTRISRQNFLFVIQGLGRDIGRPDLNLRILRNTFVWNFHGDPTQLTNQLGITYAHARELLMRESEK